MAEQNAGGAFLTQSKNEKISEVKKDIAELEELLAGNSKVSQSTLLLKKRKEMREVDEALELMKQEYKRRMDVCEERREQFEAKQSKMRDQVLKFEKYIQENDAKRLRAEMKAKQEHKLYEEKCRELESLHRKIDELVADEKMLDKELASKNTFTFYLETVLEFADGFEEVPDLLKRYYTLKQSNQDLMKLVQDQEYEGDTMRSQLTQLRTEQENQLLVNNSTMQRYQKKFEHKLALSKKEEEEKNRFEDKAKNVSRECSQVIQSVKNIYARCITTARNPGKISNNNNANINLLLDNLLYIENRLVDLIEITDEYHTLAHHEYASETGGLDSFSQSTTLTGNPSQGQSMVK
jgi:hypothetical protein